MGRPFDRSVHKLIHYLKGYKVEPSPFMVKLAQDGVPVVVSPDSAPRDYYRQSVPTFSPSYINSFHPKLRPFTSYMDFYKLRQRMLEDYRRNVADYATKRRIAEDLATINGFRRVLANSLLFYADSDDPSERNRWLERISGISNLFMGYLIFHASSPTLAMFMPGIDLESESFSSEEALNTAKPVFPFLKGLILPDHVYQKILDARRERYIRELKERGIQLTPDVIKAVTERAKLDAEMVRGMSWIIADRLSSAAMIGLLADGLLYANRPYLEDMAVNLKKDIEAIRQGVQPEGKGLVKLAEAYMKSVSYSGKLMPLLFGSYFQNLNFIMDENNLVDNKIRDAYRSYDTAGLGNLFLAGQEAPILESGKHPAPYLVFDPNRELSLNKMSNLYGAAVAWRLNSFLHDRVGVDLFEPDPSMSFYKEKGTPKPASLLSRSFLEYVRYLEKRKDSEYRLAYWSKFGPELAIMGLTAWTAAPVIAGSVRLLGRLGTRLGAHALERFAPTIAGKLFDVEAKYFMAAEIDSLLARGAVASAGSAADYLGIFGSNFARKWMTRIFGPAKTSMIDDLLGGLKLSASRLTLPVRKILGEGNIENLFAGELKKAWEASKGIFARFAGFVFTVPLFYPWLRYQVIRMYSNYAKPVYGTTDKFVTETYQGVPIPLIHFHLQYEAWRTTPVTIPPGVSSYIVNPDGTVTLKMRGGSLADFGRISLSPSDSPFQRLISGVENADPSKPEGFRDVAGSGTVSIPGYQYLDRAGASPGSSPQYNLPPISEPIGSRISRIVPDKPPIVEFDYTKNPIFFDTFYGVDKTTDWVSDFYRNVFRYYRSER